MAIFIVPNGFKNITNGIFCNISRTLSDILDMYVFIICHGAIQKVSGGIYLKMFKNLFLNE